MNKEQLERLYKANSEKEVLDIINKEGIELSAEDLEMVNGGVARPGTNQNYRPDSGMTNKPNGNQNYKPAGDMTNKPFSGEINAPVNGRLRNDEDSNPFDITKPGQNKIGDGFNQFNWNSNENK